MEAKNVVRSDVTLREWIEQVDDLPRVKAFLSSLEKGESQKTEDSFSGITYSESIKEILVVMEEYVKVLNSIKTTEDKTYNSFRSAILGLLIGIEGLLEALDALKGINNLDENGQISAFEKIAKKFHKLNYSIIKAEEQLEAINRKSADFISNLPFRDKKKQEYAQSFKELEALHQRFNIALYVLAATIILAFAVTLLLAGLVTAPYFLIPLGITILGILTVAIGFQKHYKVGEEMNANRNFRDIPLDFSCYLNTEFKSGIIPTVERSYTFFKQQNTSSMPLITEPSIPVIETFLRCSVPPKR